MNDLTTIGLAALAVTAAVILFAVPVAVMHRGHRQPSGLKVGLAGVVALVVTVALASAVFGGGAARATTQPPSYILVAWHVENPDNIWETPQTYITSVMLDEPTLDALDDEIPCSTTAQVDLYYVNNDSAALVAGKTLYGPNNPTEPLAHGAVAGDPWKYITTAPCAEKPELRPFHDESSTSDCEVTTTYARDGYFDVTFDPIANVWTENVEPTITSEGSSQAPVTAEAKAEVCAPEEQLETLAETGMSPAESWTLIAALAVVIAGLMLLLYPKRGTGAHRAGAKQ